MDKYYGDIPMYLHRIKETANPGPEIVECNPEYIDLLEGFLNGDIPKENISPVLYEEVKNIIDLGLFYGVVPMPGIDPLFKCWGRFVPPPASCSVFLSKNDQYGCAVFYTSDGSPLIVIP